MKHCIVPLLLCLGTGHAMAAVAAVTDWRSDLHERIERIDAGFAGDIGVYVYAVESGESLSVRGDESWYLASGVKVPVAIAVMRSIEAHELALDTPIVLEASDYVDGAGPTNLHRPGTSLRVDYLLEQMLVRSDNTATDALIRTVGLERINRIARELVLQHGGAITTLADVRRRTYSAFHDNAKQLSGEDLLVLRRSSPEARVAMLATLLDLPPEALRPGTLDSAFDAYYATELNSAPLSDYAHMLSALVLGHALTPHSTRYLLDVLARVQTGKRRIRAGLPAAYAFAHKTGTQHRRVCDFGIVTPRDGTWHVVIAACTRGEASLARSERALRDVGSALARSGVLPDPESPRRSP